MSDVVSMQFLEGGKPHYYLAGGLRLQVDALCVVETEHGPAIARVVRIHPTSPERKGQGPMRRVLRVATPRDLEQRKANEKLEREAYRLCRQKVLDKKLAMKLVDVTYTLEGRKAVFYFTSENRVDFRELVKDLAQVLRVKIEMRQIGVRDEARRLGGVGACGRTLCCCTHLKDFVSVSIRMAKDQNVSLNPTKVSGICGRLMCCLSYEYDPNRPKRKKGEAAPAPEGAACGGECAACPGGEAAPAAAEGARPAPTAPGGRRPQDAPRPGAPANKYATGRPGWNARLVPHDGPRPAAPERPRPAAPDAGRPGGHDAHRRRDGHPHGRPGQRPQGRPQGQPRRPEPPRGPDRPGGEGAQGQ